MLYRYSLDNNYKIADLLMQSLILRTFFGKEFWKLDKHKYRSFRYGFWSLYAWILLAEERGQIFKL